MRQSIRRNERRLRETGALRIEFHEPAEHEVDALLDIAVAVEAKSWKDRTGTALAHDDRQRAFFRLYGKTAARAGRLHITLVTLEDQPVAMYIGEILNNVFWGYKTGFDEAFAKFGPGHADPLPPDPPSRRARGDTVRVSGPAHRVQAALDRQGGGNGRAADLPVHAARGRRGRVRCLAPAPQAP